MEMHLSISLFIFRSASTQCLGSMACLLASLHATASFLLLSQFIRGALAGWLAYLSTMTESLVIGMLLRCLIPIVFHIRVNGREANQFVIFLGIQHFNLSELCQETWSVHEFDHVAGGLRV